MKNKKLLLFTPLIMLFMYLLFAFAELSLNAGTWSGLDRFMLAFIWFCIAVFAITFSVDDNI